MATAKQIVSIVKVQGTQQYVSDMKKVEQSHTGIDSSARKAASSLGGLGSSLSAFAPLAIGSTLTAGFIGFTKSAIEAATTVERLTLTFAGLYDSMDAGKAKVAWIQDFAKKSVLQFMDLAEAGTLLEAQGLRLERVLPLIGRLAPLGTGDMSNNVRELTSAFARLTSGTYGESMEIFRRFGINAGSLMAEGIKIDGSGKITSAFSEIYAAIEKITNQKFKRIGEYVESSMAVKFSNLQDAWQQMLAQFGQAWFPFITRLLNSATTFINYLTESGGAGKVGAAWANMFDGMLDRLNGLGSKAEQVAVSVGKMVMGVSGGGGKEPDILQKTLAFFVAYMENLPEIVSNVFNFIFDAGVKLGDGLIAVFNQVGKTVHDTFQSLRGMWSWAERIIDNAIAGSIMLKDFLHTPNAEDAQKHQETLRQLAAKRYGSEDSAFKPADSVSDIMRRLMTTNGIGGMGDLLFGMNDTRKKVFSRYDEIIKGLGDYQPKGSQFGEDKGSVTNMNYIDPTQQAIKDHTRRTAIATEKAVDFRRLALGGGSAGRIGITPAEFAGFGTRGGNNVVININGGNKDELVNTILALKRRGTI